MKAFMLTSGVEFWFKISNQEAIYLTLSDRKWKGNTLTSGCSVSGQSEL